MHKVRFLFLFFCGSIFFAASLHAQIPGHWEKHVVCTKCSFENSFSFPRQNVDFADSLHGMILGDDSVYYENGSFPHDSRVHVTSDGGVTWFTNRTVHSSLEAMYSLTYCTPDFAEGFDGGNITYTTDRGQNWLTRDPSGYYFDALSEIILSPSTLYRFSINSKKLTPCYFERSIDSGVTFLLMNDTLATGIFRFGYPPLIEDSLNIWAIAYEGNHFAYIKTSDGGLHWNPFFPGDTTEGKRFYATGIIGNGSSGAIYLTGCSLTDSTNKHMMARYDFVYTTNGGITWNSDSSNHGRVASLVSAGGSKLWAFIGKKSTQNNHLLCDTLAYSPNNGKNWYYDSQSIRGDSVVLMVWKDSTHGYIISYKDSTITFAKYIPPASDVPVNTMPYLPFSVSPTVTSDIIHVVSYPNSDGTISIYDVLGRLQFQKTLDFSNGEKTDISLSGLASGMYFVTYVSGGMVNSGRIIKE